MKHQLALKDELISRLKGNSGIEVCDKSIQVDLQEEISSGKVEKEKAEVDERNDEVLVHRAHHSVPFPPLILILVAGVFMLQVLRFKSELSEVRQELEMTKLMWEKYQMVAMQGQSMVASPPDTPSHHLDLGEHADGEVSFQEGHVPKPVTRKAPKMFAPGNFFLFLGNSRV